MRKNIEKHVKPIRIGELPVEMREELRAARLRRDWSQRELGRRLGLPQTHISGIESGKIVPRFDTLLDFVRSLDHDLMLVPRTLVPAVLALVREHKTSNESPDEGDRPLYAANEDQQETKERRSDET